MTDANHDARYLEMFPAWLGTLGKDAVAVAPLVSSDASDGARRYVVAGLNYIFKSLDLIPDGIDDLGYLDDAFVLRVAAFLAVQEEGARKEGVLARLCDECSAVRDFLGVDYGRLEAYVRGLRKGAARGRTVEDIVGDADIRATFLGEIDEWAEAFQVPTVTRDPKTLVKLRSFLSAKLP
jgi:uncharacterized membrane protein YkvA (DUF1232 family)